MTRVADFRALARADCHDHVVFNREKGIIEPANGGQSKGPRGDLDGKHARSLFIQALKREYPEVAGEIDREIRPQLREWRPLKSWHVQRVLDKVDRLRAAQAKFDEQRAGLQGTLDRYTFGGLTVRDPRALIADAVPIEDRSIVSGSALLVEAEPIYEMEPAPKTRPPNWYDSQEPADPRQVEALIQELIGPEGPPELSVPVVAPQPTPSPPPSEESPAPVDRKVQRQGGGMGGPRFGQNRAERRSSKGKKPEEGSPAGEVPAQPQYRSAKELERAKVALYKSFNAIERHAKNGTTRLALGDHDKALGELLSKAKRPDCKSLDEAIFKLTGERTLLAIHWDLPKTMKNWVELILNATSKGDAAQIELEMRLDLEQLGKDIAVLETALAKNPVLARTALNQALRQLKSMREQLESSESWARLGTHVQAMLEDNVLPLAPLPIVHPYIAEKRLEKLGISRKAGEDPVDLANEMVRAHNLLRDARLRDPNSSWAAVYEAANPQNKKILDKYRSRRLDGIEKAVDRRSEGKAQIKFDRTAVKKTYSIVAKDVGYGLQASGQLRTIAWQIGGAANLQQALGYEEDPSTG